MPGVSLNATVTVPTRTRGAFQTIDRDQVQVAQHEPNHRQPPAQSRVLSNHLANDEDTPLRAALNKFLNQLFK